MLTKLKTAIDMKAMLLAIFVLALATPTKGQIEGSFYIRVNQNTNLRAAPDINSARVDLALANHVLVVVDEVDDWLKIDRYGAEVYMAGWVSYRRVGGGTEVFTEFVDMICKDGPKYVQDADYPFGGFWTFSQRGRSRCAVTVRSPIGVFPADAFLDSGRKIALEGAEDFIDQIAMTLDAFQDEAPEWGAFVANAVDKIIGYEPDSEYDKFSADAYVQAGSRIVYVSRNAAFRATGPQLQQLMTVLVHEACHIYQVELKMQLHGDEFEIMCHALEMDLIDAIDVPSLKRLARFQLVNIMYEDRL